MNEKVAAMVRTQTLLDQSDEYRVDLNANGLDDRLEPPPVDVTEGARELKVRLRSNTSTSPALSAGDIDAQWEMAESSGDETVGGSMATPEQNVVQELGEAVGVTYREGEELNFGEKERIRDQHRWELDPASADDYFERSHEQGVPRYRLRRLFRRY